ncbi:MAG: hypothetical protein EXX96DRAFT_552400 [Benjaminiella poitrasii]|nr:MAG: hypothetical protein EXX96DRAFT_552400 [Benjaminiella poitrasii]
MDLFALKEGIDLQHYFELQNDKEAATTVADAIALLPSTNNPRYSMVYDSDEEDKNRTNEFKEVEDHIALNDCNNLLLIKESEISALKEVIYKWRNRALEAESSYLDQLQLLQTRYEYELKSMKTRYQRKLNEKEDIITNLKEQVDYLIIQKSINSSKRNEEDSHSYTSFTEDSSLYNDSEETKESMITDDSSLQKETIESETILHNIQDAMRAIEKELSFHTTVQEESGFENYFYPRRVPTCTSSNTCRSSATLVDSEIGITKNISKKKTKKSTFFINRIFKKAFPKLSHHKKRLDSNNNVVIFPTSSIFDTSISRSNTDETIVPVCPATKMITSTNGLETPLTFVA